MEGEFDVIVANLPWEDPLHPVPEAAREPDQALYDRTGVKLGLIRRFLTEVQTRISPEGLIYLEVPGDPEHRACFAGDPLSLSDGEVIGFRMNPLQTRKSLRRLERAFPK